MLQTINHRRCVQDLYDSGVVHCLLGLVGPSPKFTGPLQSTRTADEQRQSVTEAWKEAEGSDEQSETVHEFKQDSGVRDVTRSAAPPKKRRKLGSLRDRHTVFLAAEEDEDDSESSNDVRDRRGSVGKQLEREDEYDIELEDDQENHGPSHTTQQSKQSYATKTVRIDRRRAYWAAKAALGVEGSS